MALGVWLSPVCVWLCGSVREAIESGQVGAGRAGEREANCHFALRKGNIGRRVLFTLTVSSGWVIVRLMMPAVADAMTSWRRGDDHGDDDDEDEEDDDDDLEGEVSSEPISRDSYECFTSTAKRWTTIPSSTLSFKKKMGVVFFAERGGRAVRLAPFFPGPRCPSVRRDDKVESRSGGS